MRCTGGSTASGELILLPLHPLSSSAPDKAVWDRCCAGDADGLVAFVKHQPCPVGRHEAWLEKLTAVASSASAGTTILQC